MSLVAKISDSLFVGSQVVFSTQRQHTFRDGDNDLEVATSNMLTSWMTLESLNHVKEHFSYKTTSTLRIAAVSFFTGVVFEFARKRAKPDGSFKTSAILFLYDNFTSISNVVICVNYLALLTLGNFATALPALTFIALGYLDRNRFVFTKYFPDSKEHIEWLSRKFQASEVIIDPFTSLCTDNLLIRIIGLYSLVLSLSQSLFGAKEQGRVVHEDNKHTELETIKSKSLGETCALNRAHVDYNIEIPNLPNIDYKEEFLTFFSQVDWHENRLWIDELVTNRKYLSYLYENGKVSLSATEQVDYLCMRLTELLKNLKEHEVQSGSIDYAVTERYLRNVAKSLKEKNDPALMKEAILRLTLEAAKFCGDGVQRVSAELYSEHCIDDQSNSLKIRFFTFIQELRHRRFSGLYYGSWFKKCLSLFRLDPADTHYFNSYCCMAGQNLGLPDRGASGDITVALGPIELSFFRLTTRGIERRFWDECYMPKSIIEEVREFFSPLDVCKALYDVFEDDDILSEKFQGHDLVVHNGIDKRIPTEYAVKTLLLAYGILY